MQPQKLFEKLARQGFVRIRVNGEVRELEEKPDVAEGAAVDLVVDRLRDQMKDLDAGPGLER